MYIGQSQAVKNEDGTYSVEGKRDPITLSDKYAAIVLSDQPRDIDDVSNEKVSQGISDFLKIMVDGAFTTSEISTLFMRTENNLKINCDKGLASPFGEGAQGDIVFAHLLKASADRLAYEQGIKNSISNT